MPLYDYQCDECGNKTEVMHGMKDYPEIACTECKSIMRRLISASFSVKMGHFKSHEEKKEIERNKKVKDPERAVRARKQMFGKDSVGDPSMKTDPKHIIRRGRTIAGQQTEVNKADFVKAAAKDPLIVKKSQEVLDNKKKK